MTRLFILFALGFSAATAPVLAHPEPGETTYLANEAVMVVSDDQKLLFDPFYAETFDIYRQVPEPTLLGSDFYSRFTPIVNFPGESPS